jgi:thiamine pyrophosphokinase
MQPVRETNRRTKALVVANGRAPVARGLPDGVLAGALLVVAADGGAAAAERLGLHVDLAIGDFDSVDPAVLTRVAALGATVRRVAAEKDESDLELAVAEALAAGADDVIILGALGGERVEHALASIALLSIPHDTSVDMSIVDERSTIRLMVAPPASRLEIDGAPGDYVSLQAWSGDVEGVTTGNLRYPLADEALRVGPSRGLSNELIGQHGWVSCSRGQLLVIHTRRAALEMPRACSEVSS